MTDRYTKAVLTVIAAALVLIAGQQLAGRAQAFDAQQVEICNGIGGCASLVPITREVAGRRYPAYALSVVIEK